jgi:hypothetical protein
MATKNTHWRKGRISVRIIVVQICLFCAKVGRKNELTKSVFLNYLAAFRPKKAHAKWTYFSLLPNKQPLSPILFLSQIDSPNTLLYGEKEELCANPFNPLYALNKRKYCCSLGF